MDFELSKEQKDIVNAAREFANGEFKDIAGELDEKEKFPKDIWRKACGLGFLGLFIPEKYEGAGLGFLEQTMIHEEFWRVDPGIGCLLLATFGAESVLMYGTEEQKKKYLPPLVKGEAITATAITEPDAGSDVASIATTAIKSGEEYVINGNKMFITHGDVADYVVVLCVTDPEEKSYKKRFSMLMVETDTPGFEATKIEGKMGIRASDTAELSFVDVKVPAKNLIGVEGQGFYQVMEHFNRTRLYACGQGVGAAQGAFDMAVAHITQRKQFGQTLSKFQGVQLRIAEMATRIELARNMYYKAAWLADSGNIDHKLVSMAKLYCGETGVRVTDEALQMHGGYGYIKEYNVERFYRAVKVVEIYEGVKDIEKLIIAREILGR